MLQMLNILVILQCVFHGIRLLRLRKIGCRETINFFIYILDTFRAQFSHSTTLLFRRN